MTKGQWVLILNLIGWESGASFPDQIWRTKTKAIWDYFRHWIKNCSNTARHQFFFAVLSTHFQSKVSLEHQLPTATQVRKKRTTMKNKNTVIYLCMNLWNCRSALLIYCFFTYILDPEKHRRMHRFFFSVSANCKCQGTTWFVLIPLVVERRQWFGFVSLFFAIRFSLLYRLPGHVVSSCVLDPLTPKSDQHLISHYNITTESLIKVIRMKGNDHKLKKLLIVNQILLVSTLGNV